LSNLQDYELAALALDAYQRGYHANMPDLTEEPNDGLGSTPLTAVAGGFIVATSSILGPNVDQTANFYAIAYQIGNEVIIAYRGSDNLIFVENEDGSVDWLGADGHDVLQLAAGGQPDQAKLALEFFNHVQNMTNLPITLTGHSLGGALAGFVGHLKNVNTVAFDNTGFMLAAGNVINSIIPTLPGAYVPTLADLVFGEGNVDNRWEVFGQAEFKQIALEGDIAGVFRLPDNVDNVDMGTSLEPKPAHYPALLALALYARNQYGIDGAWTHAAHAVFTELSSDAIALELGIDGANANPGSGVMKDMIASTVLPSGNGHHGTSAAESLVGDMDEIGRLMETSPGFAAVIQDIVRFAAMQAKYGVSDTVNTGIVNYDQATDVLGVDYTDAKWTFGTY